MSAPLTLSSLGRTWMIDIDGVILTHNGYLGDGDRLLPGALGFWEQVRPEDRVIIMTARDESVRDDTLAFLRKHGLRVDHAIFGLPHGERIVINDRKPSGLDTAYAVNLNRNQGLGSVRIEQEGAAAEMLPNLTSTGLDTFKSIVRGLQSTKGVDVLNARNALTRAVMAEPRIDDAALEALQPILLDLMHLGASDLMAPAEEQKNWIRQAFAKPPAEPDFAKAVVLASVYFRPYELDNPLIPLDAIPLVVAPLYLAFLMAPIMIYREPDEVLRHRKLLEDFFAWSDAGLAANPSSNAWRGVYLHFTRFINLVGVFHSWGELLPVVRGRAKFVETLCDLAMPDVPRLDWAPPPHEGKIRLGLIARTLKPHVETDSILPFIMGLDRSRYEIIAYTLDSDLPWHEQSEPGHWFMQHVDRYVPLAEALVHRCLDTIRDDGLDIALFSSVVSMAGGKYSVVSAFKLARHQVMTSAISPASTGHASFDWMITAPDVEPQGPLSNQYTENVLMLEGGRFHACVDRIAKYLEPSAVLPPHPDVEAIRAADPDAAIFASGSSIWKLVPEVTTAWVEILAKVPNSYLVLYPFPPSWNVDGRWLRLFVERITAECAAGGVDRNRVRIVQCGSGAKVMGLLQGCDVYLDSFPFSGNMSNREPSAFGIPVVAMRCDGQRGLQGSSTLRVYDNDFYVAETRQEYIRNAVSLGRTSGGGHTAVPMTPQDHGALVMYDIESYGKRAAALFDAMIDGTATPVTEAPGPTAVPQG